MTKETVLWTGPSLESALQTAHINLWHPLLPCSHGYSCTGGILGRGVSSQKEELLHAGRSFHPHTLAMVARQSSSDTVPIVPSCCPITGQHSNKVLCHALSCHSSSISQRTEHFWGAGKGNSNLSLSMNRAGGSSGLQVGPRELMPADMLHAAAVLGLCVHLSTQACPKESWDCLASCMEI